MNIWRASTLAGLLAVAGAAPAAELQMTWEDPGEFRDIRAAHAQSQARFEERILNGLEEHFAARAREHLPQDQTLNLHVQDLDLAGELEYFQDHPFGIRIIRELYFPTLQFTYSVLGADGEEIDSGDEELKDMTFRHVGMMLGNGDELHYEQQLIDDWFAETFPANRPS